MWILLLKLGSSSFWIDACERPNYGIDLSELPMRSALRVRMLLELRPLSYPVLASDWLLLVGDMGVVFLSVMPN